MRITIRCLINLEVQMPKYPSQIPGYEYEQPPNCERHASVHSQVHLLYLLMVPKDFVFMSVFHRGQAERPRSVVPSMNLVHSTGPSADRTTKRVDLPHVCICGPNHLAYATETLLTVTSHAKFPGSLTCLLDVQRLLLLVPNPGP